MASAKFDERDFAGRAQLKLVSRLNQALASAWRNRILPEPTLDQDRLVEIACRQEEGELDGGHWQDALACLVDDLQRTACLNPLGRTIAHGLLVRVLRQRIRMARLWRRRPAILANPIEKPVIILGHMRSGTTRLQRMLASDGQFSYTRMHESLQPVPKSRAAAVVATWGVHRFLNSCNPHLRHIHPSSALAAEEEFGLHAISIHGAMFEAQWWVPGFARWCERRDLRDVYGEFRSLVQTLRWLRGEPASAVQLLKAPQFMQDLDGVHRAFPDARFIRLERDREQVVASSASLIWNQQRIQSDAADPLTIGAEWQRKTELREERAVAVTARLPSSRLLTVSFDRMERGWRGEISRIYDFLGLPLRAGALARMAKVAGRSDHRGHVYSPRQFGLPKRTTERRVSSLAPEGL